jgi:hypothetical protein
MISALGPGRHQEIMHVLGIVTELGKAWGPERDAATLVDVPGFVVAAKASVSRAQIEGR